MALGDVVRTVAPTLATGLLGPLGGVVAKIAADTLFPNEPDKQNTATPEEVLTRIASFTSPEQVAKLKEADEKVREFAAQHQLQLLQLDSTNTQNARSMRLSALVTGNRTADYMSWVVMGSFLLVAVVVLGGIYGILSGAIQADDKNAQLWIAVSGLVGSIVGYFSANALQVVSFYFGSSSGSAAKSDQIAGLATDAVAAVGRFQPAAQPRAEPPAAQPPTTIIQTGDKDSVTQQGGKLTPMSFSPSLGTEARWDACVSWIFEREGGYVNRADDRGGPTNMGITLRTLAAWRHATVTDAEVQNLTKDEAKRIYQANYWNAARCGDMPPGVDLSVLDAGVMSGPAQAVRFAQAAAGLAPNQIDGVVGPQTLMALGNGNVQRLIDSIASARLAFYQQIVDRDATQRGNLDGWRNRTELTRQRAHELAGTWEQERLAA